MELVEVLHTLKDYYDRSETTGHPDWAVEPGDHRQGRSNGNLKQFELLEPPLADSAGSYCYTSESGSPAAARSDPPTVSSASTSTSIASGRSIGWSVLSGGQCWTRSLVRVARNKQVPLGHGQIAVHHPAALGYP